MQFIGQVMQEIEFDIKYIPSIIANALIISDTPYFFYSRRYIDILTKYDMPGQVWCTDTTIYGDLADYNSDITKYTPNFKLRNTVGDRLFTCKYFKQRFDYIIINKNTQLYNIDMVRIIANAEILKKYGKIFTIVKSDNTVINPRKLNIPMSIDKIFGAVGYKTKTIPHISALFVTSSHGYRDTKWKIGKPPVCITPIIHSDELDEIDAHMPPHKRRRMC